VIWLLPTEKILYGEQEIAAKLAHVKPYVFLSGVTYLNIDNRKIRGFYDVNEKQFEGHIGDIQIMPKGLKEEAIAQLGAFYLRIQEKYADYIPIFSNESRSKEGEIIFPGERLDIELQIIKFDGKRSGRARGKAFIGGKLAHRYIFDFTIIKKAAFYRLVEKIKKSRKGGLVSV
jgi:3-hydroxymyristoyl/3-hydroxydecanoyl-(acyl carrier protein) dehydratase